MAGQVIGITARLVFSLGTSLNKMKKAEQAMGGVGNSAGKMRGSFLSANGAMLAFTAGFTGLTAIATKSVMAFGAYDKALAGLRSRLGGSKEELEQWEVAIRRTAGTTKFTMAQIAIAGEDLRKTGLNTAEGIKALPVAAKLAESEGMSLSSAVGILKKATSALNLPITESKKAMDLFAFAAGNTGTKSVSRLVESINKGQSAFQIMGSNRRDFVATAALMNEMGAVGGTAGRELTRAFGSISKHAVDGKVTIGELGVQIARNKQGGIDARKSLFNLAQAFVVLRREKGPLVAMKAIQKFGQIGGRGISRFMSIVQDASDGTSKKLKHLFREGQVDGFLDNLHKIRTDNIQDSFGRMKSAVESFQIALIKPFRGTMIRNLEAFTQGLSKATTVWEAFGKLGDDATAEQIEKITGLKVGDQFLGWLKTGKKFLGFLIGVGKFTWSLIKPFVSLFNTIKFGWDQIGNLFGVNNMGGKMLRFMAEWGVSMAVGAGWISALKVGTFALGKAFIWLGGKASPVFNWMAAKFNSIREAARFLHVYVMDVGKAMSRIAGLSIFGGSKLSQPGGPANPTNFDKARSKALGRIQQFSHMKRGKIFDLKNRKGKVGATRQQAVDDVRFILSQGGISNKKAQDNVLADPEFKAAIMKIAKAQPAQGGKSGGSSKQEIVLKIGNREVARATAEHQKDQKARSGGTTSQGDRKRAQRGQQPKPLRR